MTAETLARLTDTVAAEIRAELARQRMTQADLAQASGMSPATLARKLKGTYPFDLEELDRIAGALEVDPADLIARAAKA